MILASTDEIYCIISEDFEVPVDETDDESSPGSIPGWDLVSHVHLILAERSVTPADYFAPLPYTC